VSAKIDLRLSLIEKLELRIHNKQVDYRRYLRKKLPEKAISCANGIVELKERIIKLTNEIEVLKNE
jgi:hypothetical protein